LGLYSVYWWYSVNRELRDLGRNRGVAELDNEPGISALAFLFGGCLLIPQVWTTVTTSRRIRAAQGLVGATPAFQVWTAVILIADSLAVRFIPTGSTGAILAVLGAGLAFRTAALVYMQTFLNGIWARQEWRAEAAAPLLEPIPAGARLEV